MSRVAEHYVEVIRQNNELKRENRKLLADNKALIDENVNLRYELQMSLLRQTKTKGTPQVFGAYFYEAAKRVAHPELQSE